MTKQKELRRQQRKTQQQKSRRGKWFGMAALVALLTAIVYFTWQETGGTSGLSAEEVADPMLGSQTAPVVITEYADFGCSACRAWHNYGVRDQVLATFGDQVSFVWKDFPVITPLSPQAAEAGHCAAAQGKFWEFHDTAYEQYSGLDMSALRGYASAVGVDLDPFDQCLEEGLMRRKVQANEQEARRLGLRGTPGFAINGRPLPAPPSFEQLAFLIQQELAILSKE
jgi:protein-disulfide isomerase